MLATYFNLALAVLKWPLAIISVALLPCATLEGLALLKSLLHQSEAVFGFVGGMLAYLISDQLLFKRRFMGSSFSTLEHEFTHAIFAWLTGHRVTGLKVTWRSGGHVKITGEGNWLIAVAPYWFPTLCVLWLIICRWSPLEELWLSEAVLGATFMYHQLSTYRETHAQQSDFKVAGRLFSILFLPSANLIAAGCVLASVEGGVSAGWRFMAQVVRRAGVLYQLPI